MFRLGIHVGIRGAAYCFLSHSVKALDFATMTNDCGRPLVILRTTYPTIFVTKERAVKNASPRLVGLSVQTSTTFDPLPVSARPHLLKIWKNAGLDRLEKGEAMTPVRVAGLFHYPAVVTQ